MNMPLLDKIFEGAPAPVSPPLTGGELRDSGIDSVLSRTPEQYREQFMEAIKRLPRGFRFTSEDVRDRVGDPPVEVHRNAFGALIRAAAKQNLIALTNETKPSERSERRAGRLAIWRRL